MKKLLLLLIPVLGFAQKRDIPFKDGKVFYEKIYMDSGVSKSDLYSKAKSAFLRLFPDTKSVIQNEDKENGIITGKGFFSFETKGGILNVSIPSTFMMTLSIIVKDGKYKIEMFDFYKQAVSKLDDEGPVEYFYAKREKEFWRKYFVAFNDRVLNIFNQVENEMNKKLVTDF